LDRSNKLSNVVSKKIVNNNAQTRWGACSAPLDHLAGLRREVPGRERGKEAEIEYRDKKLSYRRETARQLRTSFLALSRNVHFTEHRICCTTIQGGPKKPVHFWTLITLQWLAVERHVICQKFANFV